MPAKAAQGGRAKVTLGEGGTRHHGNGGCRAPPARPEAYVYLCPCYLSSDTGPAVTLWGCMQGQSVVSCSRSRQNFETSPAGHLPVHVAFHGVGPPRQSAWEGTASAHAFAFAAPVCVVPAPPLEISGVFSEPWGPTHRHLCQPRCRKRDQA